MGSERLRTSSRVRRSWPPRFRVLALILTAEADRLAVDVEQNAVCVAARGTLARFIEHNDCRMGKKNILRW